MFRHFGTKKGQNEANVLHFFAEQQLNPQVRPTKGLEKPDGKTTQYMGPSLGVSPHHSTGLSHVGL